MTDSVLIVGVALLVTIDLIILITFTTVEGIRGNLVTSEVPHAENSETMEGVCAE